MAIDSRLLLSSGQSNLPLAGALSRAGQTVKDIRNAPLLEAIKQEKLRSARLSNQSLEQRLAAESSPLAAQPKFIGTPQRVNKGGQDFLVGLTQGPNGINLSETPVDGEFISTLGQTAAEIESETRRVAEDKARIDIETAGRKVTEQDTAKQKSIAIQQGIIAAPALVDVNRGLELLEKVSTGGLDSRGKAVSAFFGTTSGDVGELNKILAQDMLNTIQSFPGSLSEGELIVINSISASIGQGNEVNKRIMGRLKQVLQSKVNRAKRLAEDAGNTDAIMTINESLSSGGRQEAVQSKQGVTQPAPRPTPAVPQIKFLGFE